VVGGVSAAAVAAVVLAWGFTLLGPSKEAGGGVGRTTRRLRWWWSRRTKHSSADLHGGVGHWERRLRPGICEYIEEDADFVEQLNRELSTYGYHAGSIQ
jgi:hypothetical protein